MPKHLRLLALVGLPFIGCISNSPTTAVTVRNKEFEIVKSLSADEVVEFERLWQDKSEVSVPLNDAGGTHFKLDLTYGDDSDRWLYQTSGFVQMLSIDKSPVYQLRVPEAFNRLIGAQ